MRNFLAPRKKEGWTFVFKFKASRGDRALEAIQVVRAPNWGPSLLAAALLLGSLGVYFAARHSPAIDAITASAGPNHETVTQVMREIEEARDRSPGFPLEAETRRSDVITPLNARDPSSLVMGPSVGSR